MFVFLCVGRLLRFTAESYRYRRRFVTLERHRIHTFFMIQSI